MGGATLSRYGARKAPMRGVAAVEFGLLLPLLVVMLFGTTELGRAIYSYNNLDKTVRDAARHLSQHGAGDPIIAAEARCLAVHGTTDCSGGVVAGSVTYSSIIRSRGFKPCTAIHA